MTELASKQRPKRPEFRNIHAFKDLTTYRMTPAAWVSILHRGSGAIMFILLPFIIWMFDTSISSEISFEKFKALFNIGTAWNWSSFLFWSFAKPVVIPFPGWIFKLMALALIWAYLHHFIAGLRHLYMDVTHSLSNEFGKVTALATLILSILLTAVLGLKLFGFY